MVHEKMHWCLRIVLILAMGWGLSSPAYSQLPKVPDGPPVQIQFQIVHSFGAGGDGVAPGGGVVMDNKGNLYGITTGGGAYNYGSVYELSPAGSGEWTEAILHSFQDLDPSDGWNPIGLVIDDVGNLYGTTLFGGDGQYCPGDGCGTVFELSPGANGVWTESILYNFCSLPNCADGAGPRFAPTLGPGGSLYGVTDLTAFQLSPGSGGWNLNVLYTAVCKLFGCGFSSSLTLQGGDLYGEEDNGECCGLVYVLQPQQNGQWNQVVLYDFPGGQNGNTPQGGLTFHAGGLYGVTEAGGSNCVKQGGCGTVFELTRGSGNSINEQVLWSFGGDGGAQGINPGYNWVVFNKQGDLFGTTGLGGDGGNGVVYGMKPQQNGTWKYAVLHAFDGADGVNPDGGLAIDSKGDLFGATGGGGQYGYGVAYELSPVKQAN